MNTHSEGPTKGETLVVLVAAFVAGIDCAAIADLIRAASQVG